MNDKELKWTIKSTEKLLETAVFDVYGQEESSGAGISGLYIAVDAPEWVLTVPVYNGCFVMVRQWRHAENSMTVEFPGGVAERGEDPKETAVRELREETGFIAGKITSLGSCSPNPALFRNHVHFFLAEDLTPTGEQHLDADEFLNCQLIPVEDVIKGFGTGEMTHAFTGTAIAFYLRTTCGVK